MTADGVRVFPQLRIVPVSFDPTSMQAQVAELFRRAVAAHLDPGETT